MKVYSKENCGKCNMVKGILKTKGIFFESIDDIETVIKKSEETGIIEMPIILTPDNDIYSGTEAVRFVKRM